MVKSEFKKLFVYVMTHLVMFFSHSDTLLWFSFENRK